MDSAATGNGIVDACLQSSASVKSFALCQKLGPTPFLPHNDPLDMTDPMGLADERREPWYNHQEQTKALDRQMAHLIALQKALGWPGHGAIQLGQVTYAIAQTGVQLRASYARMNEQKLSGLDSRFAPMARRFVDAANAEVNAEGLEVRISHGTRSWAEQSDLYQKYLAHEGGKAAPPGKSAHNYGMAINIAVIK